MYLYFYVWHVFRYTDMTCSVDIDTIYRQIIYICNMNHMRLHDTLLNIEWHRCGFRCGHSCRHHCLPGVCWQFDSALKPTWRRRGWDSTHWFAGDHDNRLLRSRCFVDRRSVSGFLRIDTVWCCQYLDWLCVYMYIIVCTFIWECNTGFYHPCHNRVNFKRFQEKNGSFYKVI